MELDSSKKDYNKMMLDIYERIVEHNKNLRKTYIENEINVINNTQPLSSYSESEDRRVKTLLKATLKKGEQLPEKVLNVSELLKAKKEQEESNPDWYNEWCKLKTLTKRSRIIKYSKEQSVLKSYNKDKGVYIKTLLLCYFENGGYNSETFEYDPELDIISNIKTLNYVNEMPVINNFDGGQKMIDALSVLNNSTAKEPKKVKRISKKNLVKSDKVSKNKSEEILKQELD